MTAGRDGLWLAAILALALALRLWGLNAPLWYDEILTVDTHLRLPWGEMLRDYSMNHHYLHDILAKLAIALFGEANWSVRLPAMLLGLGSIWATWLLARDIAGARIAHLTAALLAVSYHHTWFSQNARGYTGLAFFSAVAMVLFLRGIRDPRPGPWAGFGLMLAAAVFTHLTGAFFFVALGLVWLCVLALRVARGEPAGALARMPLVGAAIGVVLSVLAYLPILPGMMAEVSAVSETSAVDVMQEYQSPLWAAAEAMRTALGEGGALNLLIGLGVIVLSCVGGWSLRRRSPLFPLAVAAHVALTILILKSLGMRVWPRFFFVDIGFLMLLIVLGVQAVCDAAGRLAGKAGAGRALFTAAAVAMLALSSVLALRNYAFPKQNLAGAFAMVEAARGPDERVYAVGYAGAAFRDHFGADWIQIFDESEYRAAMALPGPVTFVVAFPARNFRRIPQLEADRAGVLTEVAWLPGTLGDGGGVIRHRD